MHLKNIFLNSSRDVAFFVLLIAAFFAAAKTHGRQLRLERELEGHWKVLFGGSNHPWVEALWARDRIFYWSVAAAVAALVILSGFLLRRAMMLQDPGMLERLSWARFLAVTVLGSMIVAFVVTGLWSLIRLSIKIMSGTSVANPGWLKAAIWGSAFWWALTLILITAFLLIGLSRS